VLSRYGFVFGLVFATRPQPCSAQPEPTQIAPQPTPIDVELPVVEQPVVEIRVVGSNASLESLRQILGTNRLGKAELRWFQTAAFAPQQILSLLPPAKVKIHCWVDLTDPTTARLYFVAPMHDRFMLRDLDLKNRFGSFEHESLAQIIELSVAVLLNDAEAGMSRSEARAVLQQSGEHPAKPKEPIVLPNENPTTFGIAVAARYGIAQYSQEIPVQHGPGFGLYFERRAPRSRQQFGLSMQYALPQRIKNDTAGADVDRIDLSLNITDFFGLGAAHRQFIGPSLALGLGFVGARPIAGNLPGTYDLARSEHALEGYLGLGIAWASDLGKRLTSELKLSFLVVPKPVYHEFLVDESHEKLTEGRHLRFGANLALFVR
jgi:hypothetical protein